MQFVTVAVKGLTYLSVAVIIISAGFKLIATADHLGQARAAQLAAITGAGGE